MTTTNPADLAALPEVQAALIAQGWTPPEEKPPVIPSSLGDWELLEGDVTVTGPWSACLTFNIEDHDNLLLFCHPDRIREIPATLAKLLATIPVS
jgi:hypothetical protein